MTLTLDHFLRIYGLDTKKHNVKIVRHMDKRADLGNFTKEEIEIYQSIQDRPIFDGVDYIVSFRGIERERGCFFGVYRVAAPKSTQHPEFNITNPELKKVSNGRYYYRLVREENFNSLEDRLVVKWRGRCINWQQALHSEKPVQVVELLAKGRIEPFRQYDQVLLKYDELCQLMRHPDANADWHFALGSTAGVYLIVDTSSGAMYIGSASGKKGLLGRWMMYAKTGHGRNKKLKELLEKQPGQQEHFQYCILQTLSCSLSRKEVIKYEQRFKKKLGRRACSLN
jgi:hypothetical protein